MEENQKINCSVKSCRYNNPEIQMCVLQQITVTPIEGIETKQPDESMCSSYRNIDKKMN